MKIMSLDNRMLKRAHLIVSDRQKAAARREEKRQKVNKIPEIRIGDRVLLRRDAFSSCHKLEDKYLDTPHVVVARNEEKDLFEIRPALGGVTSWVNRRRVILDPWQMAESLSEIFPVPLHDGNEEHLSHSDSSESNDSEEDVPVYLQFERRDSVPQAVTLSQPLRRSSRSTRGINRNPFRLPESAVTGLPVQE